MAGHMLQIFFDRAHVLALVWRRAGAVWSTSRKIGKRLKNPCRPRNPKATYQVRKLEPGIKLIAISEGPTFRRKNCVSYAQGL